MLDRVPAAVGLIMIIWLIVARWTPALGLQLAAAAATGVPLAWVWRLARGPIDASDSPRKRAARVAALFPAVFVVMGRTQEQGAERFVRARDESGVAQLPEPL